MIVTPRTAPEYGKAIAELLPPGAAWRWQDGSTGAELLRSTGEELARADANTQDVLDRAVDVHRPGDGSWHISSYRAVAEAAVAGIVEEMPRKPFSVGSKAGDRLWSHAAPTLDFPVALVQVDHLVTGPLRVGSKVGDGCWGTRGRYFLRVRYYSSVVYPKVLWDALAAFKQSHVRLWFQDITGYGGEVSYAEN